MASKTFEEMALANNPLYQRIIDMKAREEAKVQTNNAGKELSIKYLSCTQDDRNYKLTFEVTAENIKIGRAKVRIEQKFRIANKLLVSASVSISIFGAQNITVTCPKSIVNSTTPDKLTARYIANISCEGFSAKSSEFNFNSGSLTDGTTHYLDNITGKYLGSNGSGVDIYRTIDVRTYNEIINRDDSTFIKHTDDKDVFKKIDLQSNGKLITFDDATIQRELNRVFVDSVNSNREHQCYLVLDRDESKPKVTAVYAPSGDDMASPIKYGESPSGASIVWEGDIETNQAMLLIGQVHGHPKGSEKTMSIVPNEKGGCDLCTSQKLKIPLYGIDAMDGISGKGFIHRVTPDGTVVNNIGKKDSFGSVIGLQALSIWMNTPLPFEKKKIEKITY